MLQVLLINEKGDVSLEEIRRSDILKMTHEAASAGHPVTPLCPEDSTNLSSKASVTRQPEVPSPKREGRRSFSTAHVSASSAPVRVQ